MNAFKWLAALGLAISTMASAAPASPPGDLVLGQSAPLSGPFAAMGRDYRNGAMLAFAQVNASGGIHDRLIRLVTLDDAYDGRKAVANATELILRHHVLAFFNHMFTNTVRASLPIAEAAGVPYFGPYTGSADLYRDEHGLLFLTRASFADELDKILDQVASVGYRHVAVVRYTGGAGDEFERDVEQGLRRRGLAPALAAAMPLGGRADPAVAALAAGSPEVILLGVSGSDAVGFVRAAAAAGLRPSYFARSLVGSSQLHAELGPLAAGIVITQLVPSPFKLSPEQAVVRDYLRLLAQRDPADRPSFVELEGFINARLMIAALRRLGPVVSPGALATALAALGRVDLGGYVVDFAGGRRTGSHFVELTMLRSDGTFAQ
jgi:ABC-type branched-subunit amino acid transport system substrate-binding protein